MKKTAMHKMRVWFSVLALIVLSVSCSDDDDRYATVDLQNNEYLMYYDKVVSYEKSDIQFRLITMSSLVDSSTNLAQRVKYPVDVYSVTYSTTYKGEHILASGLVCVPVGVTDTVPVLSFQNGTNVEHKNAPSEDPNNLAFGYVQSVAGLGFVVIMADYIGFGASSHLPHPYLIKEPTQQAVVDLLFAAKEFVEQKAISCKINKDLYLMGYSQGGWATLVTEGLLRKEYPDAFTVKAIGVGAGPYDLSLVQEYVLGQQVFPQPYYGAYLFNSYANYYTDDYWQLSLYFQYPYYKEVLRLFDGAHTADFINQSLTDTLANLYDSSFLAGYRVNSEYETYRQHISDNSVSDYAFQAPVRLYHGADDVYVPASASVLAHQQITEMGQAAVDLITLQGKDHNTAILPFGSACIEWFLSILDN